MTIRNLLNPPGLSAEQLKLLTYLLEEEGIELRQTETIPRRENLCELPLSFAQQRLYFLDQLEPGCPVYNIPVAYRLSGQLNVLALEQSLNEVIRRHEALRTTFAAVNGQPVQVMTPHQPLSLPLVDLTVLPQGDKEARVIELATEDAQRPFDLAHGPVFRATLVQLAEEDYLFLLNMHHIVSDGWSIAVFMREITVLYEAFSTGMCPSVLDLPIQYADFAHWQRNWLQGEVLANELSYWKKQLTGAPSVLELPTDRPRPAVQNFRGERQSFRLPQPLAQSLKAMSLREGVTLFMTLLAAFKTLLYRYTGHEDIVVGTPIAGRNRAEIERLIGFFANTLALRTDLSGDPSFRELLHRIRETALGAYAHQDLPFERLVEELQPERSLSHNPIFQVVFALQNLPRQALELPRLTVTPLEVNRGTAKFELTFSVEDAEQELKGFLEYNTDLFDTATINRMLGHFQTLLEGIVANPEQQLGDLPILTDAERQQLLIAWNDTERDYLNDKCIHELFEAQVEKTPDAVAAVYHDQQLTYRELNTKANQLAHYLRKLGVGPESLVAVCVERSLDMIVGLLGILKAGGAYVPLDPAYPEERLAFMLQDAQVQILLTQQQLLSELPTDHGAQLLCIDTEWAQVAEQSDTNLDHTTTPENLAYIIYTSGSTGKPKGVQIPHGAVVNFLSTMQREPGIAANDTLLAVTTLSFDIAGLELYLPLTVGARVVLVSREVAADGGRLAEKLSDSCATIMQATPATWQMLVEAGWHGNQQLKVLCGGESLPRDLADELLDRASSVWNMYGPTETTIWSTSHRVESSGGAVPIGRPIDNTRIYIMDSHCNLVAVGVLGELCIGGVGLARGYRNRPELAAEKFIPDPFSDAPGSRLYRTGDLARLMEDGTIECLGRIDHQVKVRGFRIELGEIEAVLSQHPGIDQAIAVDREVAGDKRLIGYVVPKGEQRSSTDDLKAFLRKKLPEYMVPSAFVFLDALPLTPNGKVDRKALPVPDQSRPELKESFVAPRTPVEELLANIWAEVLKLPKVGVHDNFFDLGGHSLLATQAMSRTCQVLKTELPLHALFEGPTLAELAERIEEAHSEEQRLSTRPMVSVSRDKDLPLSFSQQRLWFVDQLEPNSSFYNLPSALRLRGSLNIEALEQSLNEIIRRHESLRTSFSMVDGEPVQVIAPSLRISLDVMDLRDHPKSEREEEARRFATEEARRPFDLARRPLFRSKLLRLGEDDHVLLLTMHHIVSDGWSMGVLYRELSVLYRAFLNGQPSPLPELPIQYADFAVWQREWLQGEVLDRQLSYWKKQLEGTPSVLNLPTDRLRPAVQSHRGARQSFVLSKELTEQLKALSRKEGVTLFMTLLAAFKALLYQYTGQSDLVIGSPIAGRNRPETEGLIGFFVNTLVLRSDLSGNPSFRELLRQVRDVCLGAYTHQELPYQKLVEALHPKRGTTRASLARVSFAFQNVPRQPLRIPGLTVTPVRTDLGNARGALTLFIWEADECLAGSLNYAVDLFNPATINQMIGHFQTLLTAVVADPEQRLLDLPGFLEPSRSELLEAIHWASEQSWHFESGATVGGEQGEL